MPRNVIFDFDYTLADSSAGVIECVNHALEGLLLPTSSDDAIRHTIGMSLPRALVALTDEDHAEHADEFSAIVHGAGGRGDTRRHDAVRVRAVAAGFAVAARHPAGHRIDEVSPAHRDGAAARQSDRTLRGHRGRRGREGAEAGSHGASARGGTARRQCGALPVCGGQRDGWRSGAASRSTVCSRAFRRYGTKHLCAV